MTRRTLDQTRQLLIDVGIRLLHERRVSVSVTHIRLTDVVSEAGLTTGAAYRCWENQAAYHRDLAVAAAKWRDRVSIAETVESIGGLLEARAPLSEVVRVAAEANLYRYPEHTGYLTTIALRTCAPADPAVAEAGREHLATAIDSFVELYGALMGAFGRRMRASYTVRDMALALAALSEGFVLQGGIGFPHARVRRVDVGPGVGADWSLFGCAAEAVIDAFTEPDPAAGSGPPPVPDLPPIPDLHTDPGDPGDPGNRGGPDRS